MGNPAPLDIEYTPYITLGCSCFSDLPQKKRVTNRLQIDKYLLQLALRKTTHKGMDSTFFYPAYQITQQIAWYMFACMKTKAGLANKVVSFFCVPSVRSDRQAWSVHSLISARSCKPYAGSSFCACRVFLYGSDRRYLGGQGPESVLPSYKAWLWKRLGANASDRPGERPRHTRRTG